MVAISPETILLSIATVAPMVGLVVTFAVWRYRNAVKEIEGDVDSVRYEYAERIADKIVDIINIITDMSAELRKRGYVEEAKKLEEELEKFKQGLVMAAMRDGVEQINPYKYVPPEFTLHSVRSVRQKRNLGEYVAE